MTSATLAQELESAKVGMPELYRDYAPVLHMVEELIGVVPNCDPFLEIWPTGFKTYNVLVPEMLNLPASLVGQGAPKDLVGLAMYTASRAAGCMYCSAHTCAFALRRGADATTIAGDHTPVEAAVAAVAESLGRVPSRLTSDQVSELHKHLSAEDAEWVVLSIGLMGFLNKFMDAMGIELEGEAIAGVQDIIGPTGWTAGKHLWDDSFDADDYSSDNETDSILRYLRVLRHAPGVLRLSSRWTKGVSGRIGSALMMLEDEVGYGFPILASVKHKRAVKAIATVLRDNLDSETTAVGLDTKCLVAMVFAKVAENEMLVAEAVQLTSLLAPNIDPATLVEVGEFAVAAPDEAELPAGLNGTQSAAVILAKAASTSPSEVNEITIGTMAQRLDPAQIVEVVVWLSVLQMLNRIYSYFDARLGLI